MSNLNRKLYKLDLYDFSNKLETTMDYIDYMTERCMSIFKWENLPDTIPQDVLELYLQGNGNCFFTKVNDKYYVFTGGLGGEPDYNYRPTLYTVANPALNYNESLKIGIDGVLIKNDTLLKGLLPLHKRYATILANNEISLRIADINLRITSLISSTDDNTTKSAEKYLKDIEDGKLGIIADDGFVDSIKAQPLAVNERILTALIEYQQYVKSSWFNELGLNSNFNGMKKEAISDSEQAMNEDVLKPLIDTMLECRQKACEEINVMFDLNISVSLNSSWEDNQEELELEHDVLEAEADNEETENTEDNEVIETDNIESEDNEDDREQIN